MSTVKLHGILLLVALLVALQTWTRDESAGRSTRDGAATVWEGDVDEIAYITYDNPARMLRVERREETGDAARRGETYLWGITTTDVSTADSASVGEAQQRQEFPVGNAGEDLFRRLAPLRALRDLGELSEEAKEQYDLSEPERTLTVSFADGEKELEFGATVFGGAHRYALDPLTGHGYVITEDVLRQLDGGMTMLQAREFHRYDASDVAGINVRTPTGERHMVREGDGPTAIWTSPGTPGEPDQTFANFMGRLEQLAISRYEPQINLDTLELVVRIEYMDERERPLGFLEMFRAPADAQGRTEYYVQTEVTRIAAHVYLSMAERMAQDLADFF
jgi:hypothetical protein